MAETHNLPSSDNLNTKNGNFICGVVEGNYFSGEMYNLFLQKIHNYINSLKRKVVKYRKVPDDSGMLRNVDFNLLYSLFLGFYGRPWTTEQRKDLFQK